MGGYGSGRYGGRPIAEHCLRIDLAWMMRQGLAVHGCDTQGTLSWSCRGSPSGSIRYQSKMSEPARERLELSYTRGKGDRAEQVHQTIALTFTEPHYGGKRWWMVCPYRNLRVGKLYLPPPAVIVLPLARLGGLAINLKETRRKIGRLSGFSDCKRSLAVRLVGAIIQRGPRACGSGPLTAI